MGEVVVAGVHATVYSNGAAVEASLGGPESLESLERLKRLLASWRSADALVLWGEGAWRLAPRVLEAARGSGLNQYILDFVDSVEAGLSGLGLEVIVKLRLERLLRGGAARARARLSPSKRVSRRDLLRNPLASLLVYLPTPLVDSGACARLPHCRLCLESCPVNAVDGKPPSIDASACTGCMECVYSCPAWALYPPGQSREGLTGYLDGLAREGFKGVLAVVEYGRLADLYALAGKGLKGVAVLPVHSLLHVHPRLAVEAAGRGITLVAYDPEGRSPGWLLEAEASGLAVRAASLETLAEAAAGGLAGPGAGSIESTYAFAGRVVVDPGKCTVCGACANVCPTGALAVKESGEAVELLFNEAKCTGCLECAAACPEDAVEVRWVTRPEGESWRRLAWSEIHRCPSCGAVVGPKKQVEAIARKLREAGLPEPVVRKAYLCPSCKAKEAWRSQPQQ